METTQTLEKVLADIEAEGFGDDPRVKKLVERGFRAGLTRNIEQADPLAGYSNLTSAISAGEPIDYERLDGLKVQCVNPGIGTNSGKLERDPEWEANKLYSWLNSRMDHVYTIALTQAWEGKDGWALWVEGEIPLIRKTANQLAEGTYFMGQRGRTIGEMMYVGRWGDIYCAPSMTNTKTLASEWTVLEEYGPFQKPESK